MNTVKTIEKQQEVYGVIIRDETNSGTEENINYSTEDTESFNYKTSITGKLEGNDVEKEDIKTVVPLKYLSNFWRTLKIPLINCEISLELRWSKNCVLTSKATREADPDADPAVIGTNNPTNVVFVITDSKLYVPVATLSAEWNKYRSKISYQTANNNLNYLIDGTFTKVNRLLS